LLLRVCYVCIRGESQANYGGFLSPPQ
jgi:hypothetical protein